MKYLIYLIAVFTCIIFSSCIPHKSGEEISSFTEGQKRNFYKIAKTKLLNKHPQYFSENTVRSIVPLNVATDKFIFIKLTRTKYYNEKLSSGLFVSKTLNIKMSEAGNIIETKEISFKGADFAP